MITGVGEEEREESSEFLTMSDVIPEELLAGLSQTGR